MVFEEDGAPIAGSAVSYRSLACADKVVPVAIMTGSWTASSQRGRGLFSAAIHESINVAAERGVTVLMAFVTRQNPSFGRLQAAGLSGVPSSYLALDEPASNLYTTEPEISDLARTRGFRETPGAVMLSSTTIERLSLESGDRM